jgi:hypothetical protein
VRHAVVAGSMARGLKDWQLGLVVNWLAGRIRAQPQVEPQSGADGPDDLECWRADLAALDTPVVGGRDPGRGSNGRPTQAEMDPPLPVFLAEFGPGAAGSTVVLLQSGLTSCHCPSMTSTTLLGLMRGRRAPPAGLATSQTRLPMEISWIAAPQAPEHEVAGPHSRSGAAQAGKDEVFIDGCGTEAGPGREAAGGA